MPKAKYVICYDHYFEKWSWKLLSSNGRQLAERVDYCTSKPACLRAINAVRRNAKTLVIEEEC